MAWCVMLAVAQAASALPARAASAPAADWSMDPTFGDGGVAWISAPAFSSPLQFVPGSTSLLAFTIGDLRKPTGSSSSVNVIYRLTPDGTPTPASRAVVPVDLDLGFRGRVRGLHPFAVDDSGNVMTSARFGFSRLLPDFSLDQAFGTSGLFQLNDARDMTGAVIDQAGRTVFCSTRVVERPGGAEYRQGEVERLLPSGAIDRTFGDNGKLAAPGATQFCQPVGLTAAKGILLASPDGKLYALDQSGHLDAAFGSSGSVTLPASGGYRPQNGYGLVIAQQLPNGNIDVVNETRRGSFSISQFTGRGAAIAGPRGLARPPRSLAVRPDSSVLAIEPASYGKPTTHLEAFGPTLSPTPLGKSASVDLATVRPPRSDAGPTPQLLADGKLLVQVTDPQGRQGVARLTPGVRQRSTAAPRYLARPRLRLYSLHRARERNRSYISPTLGYECAKQCALATTTFTLREASPRPQLLRTGAPSLLADAKPFDLFPGAVAVRAGRYVLRVTATDAYGRKATLSKTIRVQ